MCRSIYWIHVVLEKHFEVGECTCVHAINKNIILTCAIIITNYIWKKKNEKQRSDYKRTENYTSDIFLTRFNNYYYFFAVNVRLFCIFLFCYFFKSFLFFIKLKQTNTNYFIFWINLIVMHKNITWNFLLDQCLHCVTLQKMWHSRILTPGKS